MSHPPSKIGKSQGYTFPKKDAILIMVIKQNQWIKNTPFPSFLLAGATVVLVAYLTLLSPSSLEDDFLSVRVVHPKDLLNFLKNSSEPTLAKGIPEAVTPAYSLRNFDFFTTTDNHPQLKLSALKSNFYQTEQLIHAKTSEVTLEDQTVITSKELLFDTTKNEIHFYGDVQINLESGAIIRSNYLKAVTRPILTLFVPASEAVAGIKTERTNKVEFKSYGLTYLNDPKRELNLTSKVIVAVTGDRRTQIQSDRSRFDFNLRKLKFYMDDQKNFDRQFVLTHQGLMEMKSRSVEIELEQTGVKSIAALNDVSIREKSFFSTSGKASFDEHHNTIELSDFPQVYQDSDTITGDLIIYHRNDDTIEVKQSNAIYKR
jgi:lipopolysaccharide export system protein LptA